MIETEPLDLDAVAELPMTPGSLIESNGRIYVLIRHYAGGGCNWFLADHKGHDGSNWTAVSTLAENGWSLVFDASAPTDFVPALIPEESANA